jgi:hypothetical protein
MTGEDGMFEESRWHAPSTLGPDEVRYLRSVLMTHATDPTDGRYRVCDVPCCEDWRNAYDHLAAVGELMAEPESWMLPDRQAASRP